MLNNIILIVVSYLVGSLPFAVIVCKLWKLPDPRSAGSNNPGATNVLRIGSKVPAFVTLFCDGLKGFLPTLLAVQLFMPTWVVVSVMAAALVGHIWPIFSRFKGGKGVATAMGSFLALFWPLGLSLIAIWALVIYIFKISSLGAIVSLLTSPFLAWFFLRDWALVFIVTAMAALVLYRHKDNFLRIKAKKES